MFACHRDFMHRPTAAVTLRLKCQTAQPYSDDGKQYVLMRCTSVFSFEHLPAHSNTVQYPHGLGSKNT